MSVYDFVGIKGRGMSGVGEIVDDSGYSVEGWDMEKDMFREKGLEEGNIKIVGFEGDNIEGGMSVIGGNGFGDRDGEIEGGVCEGIGVIG
ncbi:Mur ligase domain-containing protein [Bacillus pumilus]|uniref:Mur ligase domain-containing protein n=1 Tax=Bacillus pumilus TaxID=1408 RepID=UPI0011A3EC66|nr:Mur ligase domain-containing protein [Bacillus pumilus]